MLESSHSHWGARGLDPHAELACIAREKSGASCSSMPLISRAVADGSSESSLPVDILRHFLCTVTYMSLNHKTDTNSKSEVYHHLPSVLASAELFDMARAAATTTMQ